MSKKRASGILCHISSLPSAFGIGDLGPEAYRFVDLLSQMGQTYWQVLPLNPTDQALGSSPYSSSSAFAFNLLFLSPEGLLKDGLLSAGEIKEYERPLGRVDHADVEASRQSLLQKVWKRYCSRPVKVKAFQKFCKEQSSWLDDYALFVVLKVFLQSETWSDWPMEYRDRQADAIHRFVEEHKDEIKAQKYFQFLFYCQWRDLRKYCAEKGVSLIGDIPIYVNYDSADAWSAPDCFKLNEDKRPIFVAGVPPDYFSKEGQRWGNPVYDWEEARRNGFAWWIARLQHNMACFDVVRIDHFRGFVQCWEIAAEEKTAKNGKWQDVPGEELFQSLKAHFVRLPIIAEDLGIITKDVDRLKEKFGFPGMKVLLFAFHNEYKESRDLPENYDRCCVVYTGTHDNNTVKGWFVNERTDIEKQNMLEYFGRELVEDEAPWHMIDLALKSVADLAIIPVQDILGLGEDARMNRPSTVEGNWSWRMDAGLVEKHAIERLALKTREAGR